jgi:hypothetical protein
MNHDAQVTFDAIQDKLNDTNDELLENSHLLKPLALGLDLRSAYELHCTADFIAVNKQWRATLEYYGGFEYVDKDCVLTVGDYTYYFATNERVAGHLERFDFKGEE